MHRFTVVGACAVLAALAASQASLAADKTLVAIYKSGTQQYFIDQGEGFTAAARELGYGANIINVELDSNLAISAVSDAIASGAAGIGITAPDQALGPAVSKAAADAGIPLLATDDPLQGADGAVPFVGFDGTDMGDKVGEAAVGLLDDAGWKDGSDYGVLSVENPTLSVCNDRTNAARAQLAADGVPDTAFVPVSYEGTTDSALAAAGPVLTANPQVNKWVVYACNDEGVLGATNALKNAGFAAGDVIAVGLGAYEACRPWKAGIESGFKAALYISGKDVGDAAARALVANVEDGTPLPPMTVANTTIVTPENYADIMPCD